VAAGNEPRAALPVSLDLRRADLYRILDEIVRAPANRRAEVIGAFEQAWKDFKEAMAQAG
jgi:hypothetical protein